MNYRTITPALAEKFVRSKKDYLDDRVFSKLGLRIVDIFRNKNQYGRKSIYDLGLSDGSKVVLKLSYPEGVSSEVCGLTYAKNRGVLAPKLFDYELNENNPLENSFIIISYSEEVAGSGIVAGEDRVVYRGREAFIDKKKALGYVEDIINSCYLLHEPVYQEFRQYNEEKIMRLLDKCEDELDDLVEKKAQENFLLGIRDLYEYYMDNADKFAKAPYSYIHGDLYSENMFYVKEGMNFIDWERFGLGDAAMDLAYFSERNTLIEYDKQVESMVSKYSNRDSHFGVRLGFCIYLNKLIFAMYFPDGEYPNDLFFNAELKEF